MNEIKVRTMAPEDKSEVAEPFGFRPPLALALARNLNLLRDFESKSKSMIKSKKRSDGLNSTAVGTGRGEPSSTGDEFDQSGAHELCKPCRLKTGLLPTRFMEILEALAACPGAMSRRLLAEESKKRRIDESFSSFFDFFGDRRFLEKTVALVAVLCCWTIAFAGTVFAALAPIRFAGQNAELTLSEVSEWTLRLELSPLDEQGRPRPATPSTVLVPFPVTQRMRVSQLDGNLRVGRLRVSVTSQPLVVTVRRDDGKLVQELVFDADASTNAGVVFRTEAVVLGLGEGAQQFDRRGALYPMEPSWGGWNRPVLGSVVPSPFLIGTDG